MKKLRFLLSLAILSGVVWIGHPAIAARKAAVLLPCQCFVPVLKYYGRWIEENWCDGECDKQID
jgi:hypothetical protein